MLSKRFLTGLVYCLLFALAGYGGYWFYAAQTLEDGLNAYFQGLEERGYQVSIGEPEHSGFPLKIVLRYQTLEISDPSRSWNWTGQKLDLVGSPWRFTQLDLVPKGAQHVRFPAGKETVELALQASDGIITLGQNPQRGSFLDMTFNGLEVTESQHATSLDISALDVSGSHLDASSSRGNPQVSLIAAGIRLPDVINPPLGPVIAKIALRANLFPVGYPVNLQEASLESWRQADGQLQIQEFEIQWDRFNGQFSGDLTLDSYHRPEGVLNAQLANLPATLLAFAEHGQLDRKTAGLAAAAVQFFSVKTNSQGQPVISLPVALQQGAVMLGPIRLAGLPSLSGRSTGTTHSSYPAPLPDGLPDLDQLTPPPTVSLPTKAADQTE